MQLQTCLIQLGLQRWDLRRLAFVPTIAEHGVIRVIQRFACYYIVDAFRGRGLLGFQQGGYFSVMLAETNSIR